MSITASNPQSRARAPLKLTIGEPYSSIVASLDHGYQGLAGISRSRRGLHKRRVDARPVRHGFVEDELCICCGAPCSSARVGHISLRREHASSIESARRVGVIQLRAKPTVLVFEARGARPERLDVFACEREHAPACELVGSVRDHVLRHATTAAVARGTLHELDAVLA